MSLTYEEVAEILKIIDGSSCDELIVETGEIKLVVRRNAAAGHAAPAAERAGSAPVTAAPPRPRTDARQPDDGRIGDSRPGPGRPDRSDGADDRHLLSRAEPRCAALCRNRHESFNRASRFASSKS